MEPKKLKNKAGGIFIRPDFKFKLQSRITKMLRADLKHTDPCDRN